MAITSQVWNGKAFVNTDSDTVDQKNVNDGAASSSTLWTSSKVSEELARKAEKTHTHSASQVSGLHAVATNGNYESLINKPTIPPAYTHPNDSSTRHVTDAEKATWNGKANANHTHDYAPTNHSHSNYAAVSHTHTIANINGLQGEIDNLKQSVSSGKNAIASAITGKGVAASGSDTFATLSNKINQISSGFSLKNAVLVGNYTATDKEVNLTSGKTYVIKNTSPNVATYILLYKGPDTSWSRDSIPIWGGGSFVVTAQNNYYIKNYSTTFSVFEVPGAPTLSLAQKSLTVFDGGDRGGVNICTLSGSGMAFISGLDTHSQYRIEYSNFSVSIDGYAPVSFDYTAVPALSNAGIFFSKSLVVEMYATPCHDDMDGGRMEVQGGVSYLMF